MDIYVNDGCYVNMTRHYSHNRVSSMSLSYESVSLEIQTHRFHKSKQGLIRHVELVRLEWDRRQQQLER